MGLLKLFNKKHQNASTSTDEKAGRDAKSVTSLNSEDHSTSHHSTGSGFSLKKKRKSKKSSASSSSSSQTKNNKTSSSLTPNEQAVSDLVQHMNNHGTGAEYLKFFESPDVLFHPEGADPVPVSFVAAMFEQSYQSFKDLNYGGQSVKEIKPGTVLVDDNVCSGTFNGTPYQPLPTHPALEANGKFIMLDPERYYYTLNDKSKIVKCEAIALGNHTGAIGFYELAGGKL